MESSDVQPEIFSSMIEALAAVGSQVAVQILAEVRDAIFEAERSVGLEDVARTSSGPAMGIDVVVSAALYDQLIQYGFDLLSDG